VGSDQQRMKTPRERFYEREIPKWSLWLAGSKPAPIPGRYLCAGKRHDKRLMKCYGELFVDEDVTQLGRIRRGWMEARPGLGF